MKYYRPLNVQEQIDIRKDNILSEAKYWREHGIPKILELLFKEKGIDINKSIVLEYKQDYPGISTDEGLLLTPEGEFYEFNIDLNSDRTEIVELYSIVNVSERYKVSEHEKGIGKSFGYIAMEILIELNSTV